MKKIGLVGGISWSSTLEYYRYINEEVNLKLGGLNYAECIIYSINFNDFHNANSRHDWDTTFELMKNASFKLKSAGAEMILLGANTAHIVADRLKDQIDIPLIDIRAATSKAIHGKRLKKVGLLGTTYTMELDYYKDKLLEQNIDVIIPSNKAERNFIEETLLHELGKGILLESTKKEYIRIANALIKKGAEGIVLGCTELPLLISQGDFNVPVFNTTQIHALAAVEFSLSNH